MPSLRAFFWHRETATSPDSHSLGARGPRSIAVVLHPVRQRQIGGAFQVRLACPRECELVRAGSGHHRAVVGAQPRFREQDAKAARLRPLGEQLSQSPIARHPPHDDDRKESGLLSSLRGAFGEREHY